ncbi:hypothetical protein JOB18_047529 [Solea senegalensis]|uniref:Uncharacterized protein n=1 Tax=Solea senegalensis TaxID=28829 RepID=A0AAV6S1P4_SOLSE|nr:hypothetical protein JOB18_047529 [Solea senegalensis]
MVERFFPFGERLFPSQDISWRSFQEPHRGDTAPDALIFPEGEAFSHRLLSNTALFTFLGGGQIE